MAREIITKIDSMQLRGMCIRYDYYTRGDCRAYEKMFEMARNNEKPVSGDVIYKVAEDIKEHSDTEATVDTIAFNILQEATYRYFEE